MVNQYAQACIDACNTCAVLCERCAAACLQEANVAGLSRCIALDLDCAQICQTAAAFIARGSGNTSALCALCADICDECADECESHPMDHCRDCAHACRACSEECHTMTGNSLPADAPVAQTPAH